LRKVRASEFEAFLRLVDGELSQDCTIVVVGGAAVRGARGGRAGELR